MSRGASVLAVATASPPHAVAQPELRAFARRFFAADFPAIDRLLPAFDNSGIDERQMASPLEWFDHPHSFAEKNEVYRRSALEMSRRAGAEALRRAALRPDEVAALVFVSTTGIATPSLDSYLVQLLGLSRATARVPLWGLGCAGGAAGLARAADLVRALGRPVLLIAAEVCSATFVHGDRSKSNLIATALFGDGAAAVVLAPLVAAGTVFCAAGWLLRDWSVRGRRGRLLVRLAVSVAATAWLLAPSTTALSAWFLD